MTHTVGSLCTGYGGLDLAVGGDLQWYAEFDKHASSVCAVRFPGVPNLHDLTTVDWTQVAPVDVLTAGYPCQPFSVAGRRKGTDDTRHIWPYIAEAIRVLRPRHVVLENVRGHLTLGFDVVLGALADLGYDASWTLLRASEVGAPHQRARLFILATDTRGQRHGVEQDGDVVGCVDRGAEGAGPERERAREVPVHRGAATAPDASGDGLSGNAELNLGQEAGVEAPQRGYADGCVLETASLVDFGQYTAAVERWEHIIGRSAPTPTDDKCRLSPSFVEWMMGLPAGWVTDVPGLSRSHQLKILGNGVVPQQAAAAIGMLTGGSVTTVTTVTKTMPTPRTSDANGAGSHGDGGPDLRTAIAKLLPTPTARDWKDSVPCDNVPVNALLGRAVWAF